MAIQVCRAHGLHQMEASVLYTRAKQYLEMAELAITRDPRDFYVSYVD